MTTDNKHSALPIRSANAYDEADGFMDKILSIGRFDNKVLLNLRPEDFYTLWNAWIHYDAKGRYAENVNEVLHRSANRFIEKYEGWSERLSR